MNGSHRRTVAIGKKFQVPASAKWLFTLLITALLTMAATPPPIADEKTDEQYIQIMNLIDRADALRKSGQADAAKAKYKQAQTALLLFKRANPLFDTKAVSYRLQEVSERIETRPPIPSATPSSKPKVKLEASTASAKSSVKLLDPGAEPRKVLRLHPQPGEKQALLLTVKMNVDVPGMTGPKTPKMPPVTIPADVSVAKVAPNGDIDFDFVLGEGNLATNANLPPQAAEQAKKSFGSIKGLALAMMMSNRGSVRLLDLTAPPGAAPDLEQGITKAKETISAIHTATPMLALPDEPVGQGAKWEVKTTTKTNGMTMNLTETIQLTSVDGDHISLSKDVDFGMNGTPQPKQGAAAMPIPMGSMDITGKLTGTSAMDLSKLMPLQASWDGQFAINMSMKTPKGNMPMNAKADLNLTMESH